MDEIPLPVHQDRNVRRHDLLEPLVHLGFRFLALGTAGIEASYHDDGAGHLLPDPVLPSLHAPHAVRLAVDQHHRLAVVLSGPIRLAKLVLQEDLAPALLPLGGASCDKRDRDHGPREEQTT